MKFVLLKQKDLLTRSKRNVISLQTQKQTLNMVSTENKLMVIFKGTGNGQNNTILTI